MEYVVGETFYNGMKKENSVINIQRNWTVTDEKIDLYWTN